MVTTTTASSPPRTTVPPSTTSEPPTVADTTRDGLGDSLFPGLGNAGYDVGHYTLDLFFDPEADFLSGVVTVDAAATADLDTFNLDFVGFEITDLTVDGTAAPFTRTGRELSIDPAALIPSGEGFTIAVEYAGTPAPITSEAIPVEMGWRTGTGGERYVVAEPDAASSWFPSNDHPSDKATYTFRITVPDPTMAVANGLLVDTITDLGATTRVYEMAQPMPTYLATVVIGSFEIVDDPNGSAVAGVPIRNVLPPLVAASPPAGLELQGEMIDFMSDTFGPFPFDVYGIAVVGNFPAALENSTLSIFGDGFLDSPIFEFVLVHELAHQWFGDSVTPADWGDIWLNEGFATYTEWLWLEHREGPAALAAIAQGTRDVFAESPLPPPGSPAPAELFAGTVYQRGALVLHALRLEIGDDAFFETLQTYAARFGGGNATTADFVAVAEEVSGAELDELFGAWLYGDEVPEL